MLLAQSSLYETEGFSSGVGVSIGGGRGGTFSSDSSDLERGTVSTGEGCNQKCAKCMRYSWYVALTIEWIIGFLFVLGVLAAMAYLFYDMIRDKGKEQSNVTFPPRPTYPPLPTFPPFSEPTWPTNFPTPSWGRRR